MDPFSITGFAASILGLVGATATIAKRLNDMYGKFKDADLTISLISSQLCTLKAALEQILQWMKSPLFSVPRHQQLLRDLETATRGCKAVVALLDEYTQTASGFLGTLEFVWNEDKIKEYSNHLNHQANALTLFLQALQCRSLFEQEVLIARDDSIRVILKSMEATSSLLGLKDVESLKSRLTMSTDNEDLTTCDLEFEFDAEVMNSGPYRGAIVSTMKQVLYNEQRAKRRPGSQIISASDSNSMRNSAQSLLHNEMAVDPNKAFDAFRRLRRQPKLFRHALKPRLRQGHKLLVHKYRRLKVVLGFATSGGKSTLFAQMGFLFHLFTPTLRISNDDGTSTGHLEVSNREDQAGAYIINCQPPLNVQRSPVFRHQLHITELPSPS